MRKRTHNRLHGRTTTLVIQIPRNGSRVEFGKVHRNLQTFQNNPDYLILAERWSVFPDIGQELQKLRFVTLFNVPVIP